MILMQAGAMELQERLELPPEQEAKVPWSTFHRSLFEHPVI
jgi:hypothetical protein